MTDESNPTDNAKQKAWRKRSTALEALGVDPFEPQMPTDEDRLAQVQAILKEYEVAIGKGAERAQGNCQAPNVGKAWHGADGAR